MTESNGHKSSVRSFSTRLKGDFLIPRLLSGFGRRKRYGFSKGNRTLPPLTYLPHDSPETGRVSGVVASPPSPEGRVLGEVGSGPHGPSGRRRRRKVARVLDPLPLLDGRIGMGGPREFE